MHVWPKSQREGKGGDGDCGVTIRYRMLSLLPSLSVPLTSAYTVANYTKRKKGKVTTDKTAPNRPNTVR